MKSKGMNIGAFNNMREMYAGIDEMKVSKKLKAEIADMLRAAFVNGYKSHEEERVKIEESEIMPEILYMRNQYQ